MKREIILLIKQPKAGVKILINFIIQVIKDYIMVRLLMILQKKKGLRYREDILDNMGSTELSKIYLEFLKPKKN